MPRNMNSFVRNFGGVFIELGFEEIIIPSLWEQETFIKKGGPEIVNQMYAFDDKKQRKICLIPEVTGPIQDFWNSKYRGQEKKWFYISRCYRYERPQAGRYREFTQLGVELLGGKQPEDYETVYKALQSVLFSFGVQYFMNDKVKRGLGYYIEEGFEASCESLGAQKQIAGGGRYAEGVGWAIGLDRVLLIPNQE